MSIFGKNSFLAMTKKTEIIETLIKTLNALPEDKVKEVFDFTDFLAKKYEENVLMLGIQSLVGDNSDYLSEDEDIYTISDLKQMY